jgi:hypothetical protein
MNMPGLRNPKIGILQEPIADSDQIILWLPEIGLGESGHWVRISTLATASS